MTKDISSRAKELLYMIESKYVSILEELRFREEELLSKKQLSVNEAIELMGIRAAIKVILDELGIYSPENNLLKNIRVKEKASIEA